MNSPNNASDPQGKASGIWNKIREAAIGIGELGVYANDPATFSTDIIRNFVAPNSIGTRAQIFAVQNWSDEREQNTARHLYWQTALTVIYGKAAAAKIAAAHELGEEGECLDSIMDIHNNQIGRNLGVMLLQRFTKDPNHQGAASFGWLKGAPVPNGFDFHEHNAVEKLAIWKAIEEAVTEEMKKSNAMKSFGDSRLDKHRHLPKFVE